MTQKLPKITVITVVYNGSNLLENTIKSVIHQSYKNIEYVIVDGGSQDGTVGLLNRYDSEIDIWISEPDGGIYHAMNKGIGLSSGDYIIFINAGDVLATEDVFERIVSNYGYQYDYYYGDTQLIKPCGAEGKIVKAPVSLTPEAMYRGMLVSHQSFMVSRSIISNYDTKYKLIADQKWIIDCLKKAKGGQYIESPFSKYLLGGVSSVHGRICIEEKMKLIWRDAGIRLFLKYIPRVSLQWLKCVIKSNLPMLTKY